MERNTEDLTVGNIRFHLKRMIIPASIAFLCHTIYNMTDAFFASLLGTEAQAGLAFSFPIYFILLSCCIGVGQSVTANIGNALGIKRPKRAAHLLVQSNYLAIGTAFFLWLLIVPQIPYLIEIMGGQGDAKQYAEDYSTIILLGCPFMLWSTLANSALQAVGNTRSMRNVHIFAVFLNIILNPILMFGLLGMPALGIKGLALATIISQLVGCLYLAKQTIKIEFISHWHLRFIVPSLIHLWLLVRQSIAPTARMLGIGGFFFIITATVGALDVSAVAAYGIALRIEQLFLLPTISLEIALLSFASQNLAAHKYKRTTLAYDESLRYGMILMSLGGGMMLFGGYFFMSLFTDDETVRQHGTYYLCIAAAVGMLYVVINTAGAVLLGAHQIKNIMIVSVMRLIIIPTLFIGLFIHILDGGVTEIWIVILLSNIWAAWWTDKKCRLLLKSGR